jgi:hypothetical protein
MIQLKDGKQIIGDLRSFDQVFVLFLFFQSPPSFTQFNSLVFLLHLRFSTRIWY